jgi:acetyltransferase-like isoleucine patch superfamily enzyme
MSAASFQAPDDLVLQPGAILGLAYRPDAGPARLGRKCIVRAGAVIYGDVTIGDLFQCGHNAVVRENTRIGTNVVVGTNTVLDGTTEIADYVKIESSCYIPTHVRIGTRVFIGPNVTLTNDRYPLKMRASYKPEGPIIEDGVTLGAGVVVVPGVTIGRGSFIAAGAVVTKEIPPMSFVSGVPGRISALPERLSEFNMALSWRQYLDG